MVNVNEYVVVTVGVFVGFCNVDVKPFDAAHDQVVALLEFAVNVAVPTLHIGPLLVTPLDVGAAFTVTVVVLVAVQPDTE